MTHTSGVSTDLCGPVEEKKQLKCLTCKRDIPYTFEDVHKAKEILFYEVCIHGHGQQEKKIIQHLLCKECVMHFSDNWKELKELK